jgi:hypothetical protein
VWQRDSLRARAPGNDPFADVRQPRKELLIGKKIGEERLGRFTQENR